MSDQSESRQPVTDDTKLADLTVGEFKALLRNLLRDANVTPAANTSNPQPAPKKDTPLSLEDLLK